jgi:hypothetical protein
MTKKLKASLETAIHDWFQSNVEDEGWPQSYVHEDIVEHMTDVAIVVFDASFAAGKTGEDCSTQSK